jgi:spermidine/putrescine transport system permease protein
MRLSKIKSLFLKEIPFFMTAPAILWQVLFFYIPLVFIVYLSFVKSDQLWLSLTFAHYVSLFDSIYFKIIARSLIFAFFNAVICLAIAYPMAYYLALKVREWANFLLFLIILPFWTSFVVHVFAWYFVLDRNGIVNWLLMHMGLLHEPISMLNNNFSIFLVMVYCYLPFMVMPIYSILEKLDVSLLEASLDLGASPWYTFFKVTVPLSWSGIRTGFFLVFVPSFGEFVIPALLGGDKTMFVGSLVYQYFLVSRNMLIGSAFTVLSSLTLLLSAVFIAWMFKKMVRDVREGQ